MSNPNQKWSPFISCRGIVHPGFPYRGKLIAPITSSRKGSTKKKNQKESNKLLENPKDKLSSLPQGRENPEFRKKNAPHYRSSTPHKMQNLSGITREALQYFWRKGTVQTKPTDIERTDEVLWFSHITGVYQ